ncbi:hypothetical protein [Rhodohalobacter mucosus]|uniref:Uncharacterized protein n=1 Tax=Rhodohalobacter mucosus TaxID=2079485 RepID=A0A316TNQ5_9BACT|nr:hypothetical protein [Rhodohalobacter mucosus]PWN06243.1 hypothetical protein DDZ15_10465 [Rhodohalobacter mucosus]
MTNQAVKTKPVFRAEPILRSIFRKAEVEYKKTDETFRMLGWSELPTELKIAIEDDVKGYVEELAGSYSTNCPFVQKRRESIDFWINSYLDGICTLDTAMEALRLKRL